MVLTGSEGRLTFPYQRVGMVNALKEASDAPEGKYFSSLSPTVCGYLLSCYKDDGWSLLSLYLCMHSISIHF